LGLRRNSVERLNLAWPPLGGVFFSVKYFSKRRSENAATGLHLSSSAIHFAILVGEVDPTAAGHVLALKGASFNLEPGASPQEFELPYK